MMPSFRGASNHRLLSDDADHIDLRRRERGRPALSTLRKHAARAERVNRPPHDSAPAASVARTRLPMLAGVAAAGRVRGTIEVLDGSSRLEIRGWQAARVPAGKLALFAACESRCCEQPAAREQATPREGSFLHCSRVRLTGRRTLLEGAR